jgi:hypothetical protein
MGTPDFDVVISGAHISPEAWLKASALQKPGLSEEQKEVARKVGIGEEEYARGVVAMQLGEEVQRERGRILGERIQEILRLAGPEYILDAVIRQGTEFRWVARVTVSGRILGVTLPMDLVDDVVDSGSEQELVRLKNLVLFGIGRQELILKH